MACMCRPCMGLLFFRLLLFPALKPCISSCLQMQQLQQRLLHQAAVCKQLRDELDGAKVCPMHTKPAQLILHPGLSSQGIKTFVMLSEVPHSVLCRQNSRRCAAA